MEFTRHSLTMLEMLRNVDLNYKLPINTSLHTSNAKQSTGFKHTFSGKQLKIA